MGVVYDAWDPLIARRVAVKSVPLPSHPDPETAEEIARFRREAQAAGRLTHPNIVAVYDYGETADLAYIVMEHVDGPTLKTLLDKRERFSLEAIRRIMGDVLAGLQFSHDRGVVHRDIKPGNIMLTADGQAKIADFGIARIEMSSMTQAGTMLGTPAYMSPEQFRGEAVDARTDVYSAGVLLYQLLTGERPFEGGLTTIMHKVLNTEPPVPSQLAGTVPHAVDAVVQKAMAKRPQDRFASAGAFAEALRAAIAEPTQARAAEDEATLVRAPQPPAAPIRTAPVVAQPPPAAAVPRKSRLPLLVGVAVVLVLLLAGAGWFLTRPPAQLAAATAAGSAPTPAAASNTAPVATPQTTVVRPVPPPAMPLTLQPAEPAVAPATTTANPAPAESPPTPIPTKPATTKPAESAAAPATPLQPPATPAQTGPTAAASTAAATPPPPAAAETQTASIAPAAMLQQIAQALHDARCALANAVLQDAGGLLVNGLADTATAGSLQRQIASQPGTPPIVWRMQTVNPVFCSALALLRPISVLAGAPGPGVGLTLHGNKTVLQDGEAILPRITMPDFAGELRVDYLAHDGTLAHLYPTAADPSAKLLAQPSRRLAAGERLALGDPGPGKPQWEAGTPYGTDMIIAVASSVPLHVAAPGNAENSGEAYLADLGGAIERARAAGARVSGALLLVDAVAKTN
jgi:serine/threonine-protein kinase